MTRISWRWSVLSLCGAVAAGASPSDAPRGELSEDVIMKVVQKHVRGVRACYEVEQAKTTALAGKVVLDFTIGLDGKVTGASVNSNTMPNGAVAACLVQQVATWEFPAPTGGEVKVTY